MTRPNASIIGRRSLMVLLAVVMVGCQSVPEPPQRQQAPQGPRGSAQILDFGTITFGATRMNYPSAGDPNTVTDVQRLQPRVDQHTDQIAAIRGNRFGFLFAITGLPSAEPVRLKRVSKHPSRRMPGGGSSTESVDEFPVLVPKGGAIGGCVSVTFHDDTDMLPGKWSLELWRGEMKLLAKEFTVFATRPLPVGPRGSYDLEAVWGPLGASGLQLGLASPEPGLLGASIRNQGQDAVHYNNFEVRLHPGLRLFVRGPDGSMTPLNNRQPPLKLKRLPRSDPAITVGVAAPGEVILGGLIPRKRGRLWNCSFAVPVTDFEWPVFIGDEVEIQMELDLRSPDCTNGWQGRLQSGILVLPTSALTGRKMSTPAPDIPLEAKVLDYGPYRPVGESRREFHPGIANKSLDRFTGTLLFLQRTDHIPGLLNTHFGYTFEIAGLLAGTRAALTCVTSHPPIRTPDGQVLTQHRWNAARVVGSNGVVNSFMGYSFEESYEIVYGEWVMEVLLDGKRVLQKRFTVFDPNQQQAPGANERGSQ